MVCQCTNPLSSQIAGHLHKAPVQIRCLSLLVWSGRWQECSTKASFSGFKYSQRNDRKFLDHHLKVTLTIVAILWLWPWVKLRKYSFPSTPFVLFFPLMDFDGVISFFKADYWSFRRWPLFTTIKLVIYRKSAFHNPPNSPFIPNYCVNKAPSIQYG